MFIKTQITSIIVNQYEEAEVLCLNFNKIAAIKKQQCPI